MSIVNRLTNRKDKYYNVIEQLVIDKLYDRLISIEWDHFSAVCIDKINNFYIIEIFYFSQHGVGGDYFTEEYKLCGVRIKANTNDTLAEINRGIERLGKKLCRLNALEPK